MPLYKRPEDVIEDTNDQLDKEEQTNTPQFVVDEESTWKKRYGDLRRHQQSNEQKLINRVRELEEQINTPANNLPRTREEVEAWAAKYPDVYDLLTSMIGMNIQQVTQNLDNRFQDIERDRLDNAKERALNAIVAAHPDFYDLEQNKEFHEWLGGKSTRLQNAIYENETDAQAAIEVLDMYKLETGAKKRGPGRPANKDNAREVRVPNTPRVPTANAPGDYDFSESQIEAMSIREYENNEQAIEDARRKGRILQDLSGGAR